MSREREVLFNSFLFWDGRRVGACGGSKMLEEHLQVKHVKSWDGQMGKKVHVTMARSIFASQHLKKHNMLATFVDVTNAFSLAIARNLLAIARNLRHSEIRGTRFREGCQNVSKLGRQWQAC